MKIYPVCIFSQKYLKRKIYFRKKIEEETFLLIIFQDHFSMKFANFFEK